MGGLSNVPNTQSLQVRDLRKIFKIADSDASKKLSMEELNTMLTTVLPLSKSRAQRIVGHTPQVVVLSKLQKPILLNSGVFIAFLGDHSIWSFPSVLPLSDYSI